MKFTVEIHDPRGRITAKEIEQRLKAAWLYPAVKVRVVKESLTVAQPEHRVRERE